MRSVGIYTLGCKVSQYESEAIAEGFESLGFEVRPFSSVCDVYVINTCTVTEESDRKSRQFIRRACKTNPEAVVAVVGCYSQRAAEKIAKIEGVSIILGTNGKMRVPVLALEYLRGERMGLYIDTPSVLGVEFERMSITRAPRTRAYVKIEDGCESRCTYCAICHARGTVRSKAKEDVIAEVEALARSGVREIVLTGIETGSYGRDFGVGYGLGDLIAELDRRGSCERIRLGSLAPELVGKAFVDKIKDCGILAPHFHLSVQSGSDRVLALMKRRYNRRMLLNNIELFRQNIRNVTFTTDLMVGFPGESEEDFLDTLSLVGEVGFLDAHVFQYSRRAGTVAEKMDNQIPDSVKRERSQRLIAEKCRVRDCALDTIVKMGEPLSCILECEGEDGYTAHSDTYVEVRVKAPKNMQGEIVKVVPVSHKDGVVYGTLAE